MDRRVAAIVAADVVNYSTRMEQDEADTARRLASLRALLNEHIESCGARVVNWAGDGLIAEFASPVSAVRAAYEIQRKLAAPLLRQTIGLDLRIGVHVADVLFDDGDLIGDGVNIASRIEAQAEPGTVFLSRAVFDLVKRNAQLKFQPQGSRTLKNISDPVDLFSVIGELGNHSLGTAVAASSDTLPETAAPAPANSIVVIPFRNLSNDEEEAYFAEGFSEDIIIELGRFAELIVTSRSASFALRGVDSDAVEIGRRAGARFCLQGGIRRLGSRVRINCHLTDCQLDEQVWSEKFDCSYDDLFDTQDLIIGRIVAAVAMRIERQISSKSRRKLPADMEAYDCLARGLSLYSMGGVTRENTARAEHWFAEAIAKDPALGRAYSWRACAIATLAEWDGTEYLDTAIELARKAIELDPTSAEPYRIMGSICLYTRDYDRSLFFFRKALEFNPNHAYVLARTGEVHNFLGDGETALDYMEQARRLDPFLPEYCRELEVTALYVLGRYDDCLRVVGEFGHLTRRAAAYRAAATVRLGDTDLVLRAAHDLIELDPGFSPESFVSFEFYRDRDFAAQLQADLEQACQKLADSMAKLAAVQA